MRTRTTYYITCDGQLYSTRKGDFLKFNPDTHGYLRYHVRGKQLYIHREVAKIFVPNPLNLKFVNHIDGNKTNNNVTNLEWCTHADNMRHASKHKLCASTRKFMTPKEEALIYELRDDGLTFQEIADMVGVSYSTVKRRIGRKKFIG